MNRKAVIDVAERTAATFAVTFVSVYSFTNLGDWKPAVVAGGAAALSFVKSSLVNLINK